jgi:hypothetical protein
MRLTLSFNKNGLHERDVVAPVGQRSYDNNSAAQQENFRFKSCTIRNDIADPAGLTMNIVRIILRTRGLVMGMEDRDWYRDKEIWDRGGLRERNPTRRRLPKYSWCIQSLFF